MHIRTRITLAVSIMSIGGLILASDDLTDEGVAVLLDLHAIDAVLKFAIDEDESFERPESWMSLGSFARRNEISILLQGTYDELSQIDPRNDGQMIFYDQVIPGGTLLGFVKSDHWAVALPLTRQHPNLAPDLLNHNEFPREVLLESAVRFVEERLLSEPPGSAPAKAGADRES